MYKTIIVDDEPLALDILETFVSNTPNLSLIARCNNAFEALDVLRKGEVDLLFTDIQMPQLSGVELVKSLQHPPKVIFTTAHPDFAVQGFDLGAVDYLLKPIAFDRFLKAVNKAIDLLQLENQEHGHDDDSDYIFVKADKKLVKIAYNDILFVEGLKDYVVIKTPTGRVVTLQTMSTIYTQCESEQLTI